MTLLHLYVLALDMFVLDQTTGLPGVFGALTISRRILFVQVLSGATAGALLCLAY